MAKVRKWVMFSSVHHIRRHVMLLYLWLGTLILITWLRWSLLSFSNIFPFVINKYLVGWDSVTVKISCYSSNFHSLV